MESLPVRGIVPGVDERLTVGPRQLLQSAEISVIAMSLTGQHRVQGVVEIVAPLSIQSITTGGWGTHDARIIEIAFGDEMERPALALSAICGGLGQFRQNMPGAEVVNGVNRIQP